MGIIVCKANLKIRLLDFLVWQRLTLSCHNQCHCSHYIRNTSPKATVEAARVAQINGFSLLCTCKYLFYPECLLLMIMNWGFLRKYCVRSVYV